MKAFDVFNGDADGICALLQLRLEAPKEAELVTGVKRDIQLLERVEAASGDQVTVLDISMDKNVQALNRVLDQGASVFYVDHHLASSVPEHPALNAIIDTDPNVCTSLLVDRYLGGKYRAWAVTAAFGDNILQSAVNAGKTLDITDTRLDQLRLLGTCINYNGYGSDIADLHFPPAELYLSLVNYKTPFDFMADRGSAYEQLRSGYEDDMAKAAAIKPEVNNGAIALYLLPDEAWSRRVSGVYGNQLANSNPDCAHAVVSYNKQGGYLVSVRAPLNNRHGAGQLCQQFESGGGREGAAGINHLPIGQLSEFIEKFNQAYGA